MMAGRRGGGNPCARHRHHQRQGGVEKPISVANLGFALSQLGKNVLILDADFGLGNLDVLLEWPEVQYLSRHPGR